MNTQAAASPADIVAGLSPAISTVRVVYPDLHGIQRGKDIPIGEIARFASSGINFCQAVMGTDLRHTPVVGGEVGYPDMVAHPDLSTLVELPWEPDVATCLADLERDGAPEPTDQRQLVRRAEEALAELGFTAKVGPELEFFLLESDDEGGWRRHVDNLSMVYTVGPQADPQGVLRGLLEACAQLGLGAIAANHEYMNSQYEINLREATPLTAADNAFRFKAAVKDYSAQRGLLATFMGKPFNDQGGSGTHMHVSLERDGSNCMGDDGDGDGLSAELRNFTGGVLAHAPALMAFLNPTINAYRRILPDSLAPTHANWGLNNRTTFVRIPPERGSACRLEIRVGDGAANPHLVTAAILFAGLDGMRNETDPGPLLEGDTYTLPEEEQGATLPNGLDAALDALEADEVLREAVGAETVDTFLAMKRFEAERYRLHVSDWDLDEYLHHLSMSLALEEIALDDVDLTDHSRFAERVPHEMFRVLRREDPVHWQSEPEGRGFWAITRHADITAVAKDWRTFSSELGGTSLEDLRPDELEARKSMIDMDPPPHNALRAIVNRDFTPRAVRVFTERIRELFDAVLDEALEKGEVEFIEDVAAKLPMRVFAEMLGAPEEDHRHLVDLGDRMLGKDDPEYAVDPEVAEANRHLPFSNPAALEMFEYGRKLGDERRECPRDDIVTKLVEAEIDGCPLTEHEYDVYFLLLAVAGNETTRHSISQGLLALIENPDQLQRLRSEPELVPLAANEILRWATPVHHFRRTATTDVEFGGREIKQNDKVATWYISGNFDEDVFDDPYSFNVGRDPNPQMTFGPGGPHFCTGAHLARLEIEIVFEEMLKRVSEFELTGEPERLQSNFFNGIKRMPVRLTPA